MHDGRTTPGAPVSRQRLSQRRALASGLCSKECGRPLSKDGGVLCERCRVKNRLRVRAAKGGKPWQPGGQGRTPLGKRAEMHALRATGLAKLTEVDRVILCLTPKAERDAMRSAALAKLTNAERGVLRLSRLQRHRNL